jgi:DNA-binding NarL/FixJ family response regulator
MEFYRMDLNRKIRVLIADDHKLMRAGLKVLLRAQDDIEVVGEAGTGEKALQLCEELRPDVAIMDVQMPGMDGIEAAGKITDAFPDIKILSVSADMPKYVIEKAVRAGSLGLMQKESTFSELADGIRSVYNNQKYLCPCVKESITNSYLNGVNGESATEVASLTQREYEVVRLLSEGMSVKDVADEIGKSPKTIDASRREIMKKIGISSTAELTKFAIREGLTTLS